VRDIEMVIVAMDLPSAGRYYLFAIASSDSNFTPLAIKLRESGAAVFGYGEKKTPDPFIKSCDRFIFTEDLETQTGSSVSKTAPSKKSAQKNIGCRSDDREARAPVRRHKGRRW
jgi:uncharacterized LabA/DUF88 family protein